MKKIYAVLISFLVFACSPEEDEIMELAMSEMISYNINDAHYVVENVQELVSAISKAENGQVIYLKDDVQFNFAGENLPLLVDKSIHVVSGRREDNSNGATLYSNVPGQTLIKIEADNVTLYGLKIIGHDKGIGREAYNPSVTTGVIVENNRSLRIENCEISGWSASGIKIKNSEHNVISRNYIHHNQRTGLGYGISITNEPNIPTHALIINNFFEYNRHDITATGNEGQSFEASHNTIGIGGGGKHHRFDMHGKNGDKEKVAGTFISIHHNSFLSDEDYAVKIRGIPEETAEIYENVFAQNCRKDAVVQQILKRKIKPKDEINMIVSENMYGSLNRVNNMNCGPELTIN